FGDRQQPQSSSGHSSENLQRSPYTHSVSPMKPTVRQAYPQFQQSSKLRSDLVTQI
ncbi:unnamed protein product, partial [Candidula unifasciata]